MLDQFIRSCRRAVPLEIGGRRRHHERHFVATYGDHVFRNTLTVPYPRIETPLDNVNERTIYRNIDTDLRVLRNEAGNDWSKNEIGRWWGNRQAQSAAGSARNSFAYSTQIDIVNRGDAPRGAPRPG